MKIYVYVDGFNLYYGCLKRSSHKWFDLYTFSKHLFPKDTIAKIKYFTAQVKVRPNDKDVDKPNRQQMYLRALRTIPQLEIIYGNFLAHNVLMKKANGQGYERVVKTEEKGTDVNIASHLINDGYKGEYELAVVISNDSDLVEPVRIVTNELKLPVIVVSPYQHNSIQLKEIASSVRHIRKGLLKVSQFTDVLNDETGEFTKPNSW